MNNFNGKKYTAKHTQTNAEKKKNLKRNLFPKLNFQVFSIPFQNPKIVTDVYR